MCDRLTYGPLTTKHLLMLCNKKMSNYESDIVPHRPPSAEVVIGGLSCYKQILVVFFSPRLLAGRVRSL